MTLSKVWVFAETAGDKVTTATLELLTKAREIGSTVEVVYAGTDAATVATSVGEYGATKVFHVDPDGSLPGAVAGVAIAGLVAEHHPDLVLFVQSYDGRDALARLSVKLDRPVLTNGMSLSADGDALTFGTAIFGGVTLVDVKLTTDGPALIAMNANVMYPSSSK